MKQLEFGVILLALMLAAMAIVPVVSAQDAEPSSGSFQIIESNYVTKDTATTEAHEALVQFSANGLLDKTFTGAMVNPEPATIYDINGMKLFYLFSVENGKENVGEIKIAASKVLGAPVISIGMGPGPINRAELERKVADILRKQGMNPDLSTARLVCYEYPRIGMMVGEPGNQNTAVVDAYEYSVIPVSEQTSFYGSFSSSAMSSGIAKWNAQAVTENGITTFTVSPHATVSKTLSGFTLYPQQGTNWCAFAAAQMISQWYGYYRTQQQIASTVGVSPDNGATEAQMRDGYYKKSTTQGGLGKGGTYVLPGSPSNLYDLIKTEIDGSRPLVINIGIQPGQSTNYHARACAGYSRDTINQNTYFYIYNPWPVNVGSLTWEQWFGGSSPYTSSIFVKN
jgi:hypothetical protein